MLLAEYFSLAIFSLSPSGSTGSVYTVYYTIGSLHLQGLPLHTSYISLRCNRGMSKASLPACIAYIYLYIVLSEFMLLTWTECGLICCFFLYYIHLLNTILMNAWLLLASFTILWHACTINTVNNTSTLSNFSCDIIHIAQLQLHTECIIFCEILLQHCPTTQNFQDWLKSALSSHLSSNTIFIAHRCCTNQAIWPDYFRVSRYYRCIIGLHLYAQNAQRHAEHLIRYIVKLVLFLLLF